MHHHMMVVVRFPQKFFGDVAPLPALRQEGTLQVDAGNLGTAGGPDGGGGPKQVLFGVGAQGGEEEGDPVGGAEIPEGTHLSGAGYRPQVHPPASVNMGVNQTGEGQHPVAVNYSAVGIPRRENPLDAPFADAQVTGPDLTIQNSPDIGDSGDNGGHKFPLPGKPGGLSPLNLKNLTLNISFFSPEDHFSIENFEKDKYNIK